jgi:hypothetical protein
VFSIKSPSCSLGPIFLKLEYSYSSLERPRHRWENNIKMVLREIGWGDMDWNHLAQDRGQWMALKNMVMKFRFHIMLRISQIVMRSVASQEGLSSMELECSYSPGTDL